MHSSDFSVLYQSSYAYIYQLVFSITPNRQTAEDTVQDIYLAAWLCFRDKAHPNPFGWLILTARHKACDSLRRQIRESRRCIPLTDTAACVPVYTVSSAFPRPGGYETEMSYGQIRRLLRGDEFDLIIARYEMGFSVDELSEKLRISPAACYMRLHRARRKLEALIR